jgi:hypothetical protein
MPQSFSSQTAIFVRKGKRSAVLDFLWERVSAFFFSLWRNNFLAPTESGVSREHHRWTMEL